MFVIKSLQYLLSSAYILFLQLIKITINFIQENSLKLNVVKVCTILCKVHKLTETLNRRRSSFGMIISNKNELILRVCLVNYTKAQPLHRLDVDQSYIDSERT